MSKNGGYLTLKIRLLNGRLFNKYLSRDERALYNGEQGKILSALWAKHPQSASQLAQVTGLANSSLSIMLKHLEEQELVFVSTDPTDKRKRIFDLTELGLAQQKVGSSVSEQLSQVFYKGFSEQEIQELEAYLERILENLEEALQ